jgi:hypothetical protein
VWKAAECEVCCSRLAARGGRKVEEREKKGRRKAEKKGRRKEEERKKRTGRRRGSVDTRYGAGARPNEECGRARQYSTVQYSTVFKLLPSPDLLWRVW